MMLKTKKELEIFFKLIELYEAKKQDNLPYTLKHPNSEHYRKRYEIIEEEYFDLIKKLKE